MPSGIYKRVIPVWNKGKTGIFKHTEKWKLAMSERMTGNTYGCGKPAWNKGKHLEYMQGNNHPMYGKKHTEASILKMSIAKKGKRTSPETEFKKGEHRGHEFKSGHIPWIKGKKTGFVPKGAFKKGVYAGEKHYNWKGGITPINQKIRQSVEYKLWRSAVFERDDYTCLCCGEVGGRLEADHIKPFSLYPEKRMEISNGQTLCKNCHLKVGWNYFRHKKLDVDGNLSTITETIGTDQFQTTLTYTLGVLTGVSKAVKL